MATHQTTVIAFDAGNLDPVIEELKKSPSHKCPLIIAGDDDIGKDHKQGRQKAEQAAYSMVALLSFLNLKIRKAIQQTLMIFMCWKD
jgi:phage/plasmid primase-like uncharacterized protein